MSLASPLRRFLTQILPTSSVRRIRGFWHAMTVRSPRRLREHLTLFEAVTSRNAVAGAIDDLFGHGMRIGVLLPRAFADSSWNTIDPFFSGDRLVFTDEPGWIDADFFLVLGLGHLQTEALRRVHVSQKPCYVLEEGFFKNVVPGALAKARQYPAILSRSVSYRLDSKGPPFYAGIRTDLESTLDSDSSLTDAQRARAGALIARVVRDRLSKYNCQPLAHRVLQRSGAPRILVIDQAYQDLSVILSGGTEATFHSMLADARREHPDAEILVKLHVEHEGRETYFGRSKLPSGVRVIADGVNPIALIESVDEIYTYSSTMGWEGVMCGKSVHVYGSPIYAGWGLTRDRRPVLRPRSRTRSAEELFHFLCVDSCWYVDPRSAQRCSIEEALDFLVQQREQFLASDTPSRTSGGGE